MMTPSMHKATIFTAIALALPATLAGLATGVAPAESVSINAFTTYMHCPANFCFNCYCPHAIPVCVMTSEGCLCECVAGIEGASFAKMV